MADGDDQQHPNLHLTPDERRLFGQLFSAADSDKIGVVPGEVAVKFFEKTRLPPAVLGEIWQIADEENRGLLTKAGFGIVLRLIGYAQTGRQVSAELALKPGGPLPRFDGFAVPPHPPPHVAAAPLQPQSSGGPIRVPPLVSEKVAQYSSLFDESGAQNGLLSGETAKQIFERAQLPNEVLGRIWNLADTELKGELGLTEFIIAMHLLASYKNGSMRALPQILPAGLYEAASRRGPSRQYTGSRPTSGITTPNTAPRNFSGSGFPAATASPDSRPSYTHTQSPGSASEEWAVTSRDKENFDQIFTTVDTANRGFITGDQAVGFFSNSRLPEEVLAQIWDLADIQSQGRLNREEFAVAMFLIRQQRTKKDARDVLPQTLPSNLVPPSMRQQPVLASQPTAPAFDNATNITVPKSASEDLLGLDAFTSAPPQIPQSTGDSALYTSTPPLYPVTPQIPPAPPQSSTFKPFVPSSSFGQAMMTSPSTGLSKSAGTLENRRTSQKTPSAAEDLLGDNDPEVSKKLTQETTELANLSNQVSTLTGQMQEVKAHRVSTEQDLSKAQSQKRDFEARLSQLRSSYEQEVISVKALEERLSSSRNEIKKLEREIALIDGTYQDMQNQLQQVASALDMDQKENTRLKEQIRQTNNEINELKPQLEKIKSELRHQKGLVTINKKQLAINEGEREKLKSDLEGTSKELDNTTREVQESTRNLEVKPDVPNPIPAASPRTSTNMNPFFRQAASASTEKGISSPFTPTSVASPNHNAFDSFFGPPVSSSNAQSGPPPTSFGADSQNNYHESPKRIFTTAQSVKSSDGPDLPTPSDSPPQSTYNDSPQSTSMPPAPAQSRQITSSFLPLRNLQRTDSTSSSVQVVPPASRMGDTSGFDTPIDRPLSSTPSPGQGESKLQFGEPITKSSGVDDSQSMSDALQSLTVTGGNPYQNQPIDDEVFRYLAQPGKSREIPGAFPGESTPPAQQSEPAPPKSLFSSGDASPNPDAGQSRDPFSSTIENRRTPTSTKDDFNAAFEGFGNMGKVPEKSNGTAAIGQVDPKGVSKADGEFPPIQDVGADGESDSEYSDHGFDDNFTAASPRRPQAVPDEPQASLPRQSNRSIEEDYLAPSRPLLSTNESNQSQLPTPGAQVSPPTYDQTISPHGQTGKRRDSNHFPAEYTGLLPSREVPTSPPPPSLPSLPSLPSNTIPEKVGPPSTVMEKEPIVFDGQVPAQTALSSSSSSAPLPLVPGASAAPYAYDQTSAKANQIPSQPPVPAKTALNDDFDNEFGDLSEAKEADDNGDNEFNTAQKDGFDEFNPVFDSPYHSRSTPHPSSSTFSTDHGFRDFESSIAGSGQISNSRQTNGPPLAANHDWNAMFASLETPQNNSVQAEPKPAQGFSPERNQPPGEASSNIQPSKPPLAREFSTGTDHDDPILKRLTGMGYPRDASLNALEKFDYNINMVRLPLAGSQ
ncbi:hypothetical protein MMC29_002743 [Sticta canariensis]|nr:hypothetical protein [Sticta canariensis]